MAGLKNFLKRLSAAQIIFSLIAVISLILYLILTLWWRGQEKKLTDQQAADRWGGREYACLLYTSPSPRDLSTSRMPSSA